MKGKAKKPYVTLTCRENMNFLYKFFYRFETKRSVAAMALGCSIVWLGYNLRYYSLMDRKESYPKRRGDLQVKLVYGS
jgi:hypothetical protein